MLHKQKHIRAADQDENLVPVYGRRAMDQPIPKFELPQGELDPDTAYSLIHDELMLDGNARLNLATFVTTWMEPQAERLMAETFDKNMIDKDEYPFTAQRRGALREHCVTAVSRARHRRGRLGHWVVGGGDVGGDGIQMAVAQSHAGPRQTDR